GQLLRKRLAQRQGLCTLRQHQVWHLAPHVILTLRRLVFRPPRRRRERAPLAGDIPPDGDRGPTRLRLILRVVESIVTARILARALRDQAIAVDPGLDRAVAPP